MAILFLKKEAAEQAFYYNMQDNTLDAHIIWHVA